MGSMSPRPLHVTFVCSGNICRSPMGHVILARTGRRRRASTTASSVTSSGTGDWHVGEHADPRTVAVLAEHGYDGSRHRAREFDADEFADLDLVLASDEGHVRALQRLATHPRQPGQDPARARVRPRGRRGRHAGDGRPVVRRRVALPPLLHRRSRPPAVASSTTSGTRSRRTTPDPMPDLNLTVPDYPYGAPCWVDLLVSDVERAQSFYSELFGWRWLAGDAATGGYTMALLDGHPVAGISRKPVGAPIASQWTTYLRVGQIEVAAGGHRRPRRPHPRVGPCRSAPSPAPSSRSTPAAPTSACGSPATCRAAALLDAPGSLTWNELLTRDYDRVQAFQLGVFGHEFTDETEPGGPRWATAHTGDGNPAYGLAEIGDEWPREIPPHWVASFAAEQRRAVARQGARPRRHAHPGPVRRPLRRRRRAQRPRGRGLLDPRPRPGLTNPTIS